MRIGCELIQTIATAKNDANHEKGHASAVKIIQHRQNRVYGKEGNGKLKRTAETETDDGKWAWSRTQDPKN